MEAAGDFYVVTQDDGCGADLDVSADDFNNVHRLGFGECHDWVPLYVEGNAEVQVCGCACDLGHQDV